MPGTDAVVCEGRRRGDGQQVHGEFDAGAGVVFDPARDTRWGAVAPASNTPSLQLVLGFEYDHLFMGNRDVSSPTGFLIVDHIKQDVDLFTVRVNYKFGGPAYAPDAPHPLNPKSSAESPRHRPGLFHEMR